MTGRFLGDVSASSLTSRFGMREEVASEVDNLEEDDSKVVLLSDHWSGGAGRLDAYRHGGDGGIISMREPPRSMCVSM
jgi:hypothetical protein